MRIRTLNTLNCMNYLINEGIGEDSEQYYGLNGMRTLFNISKRLNLSFKELCLELLKEGNAHVEGKLYIAMI